LNGEIAEKTTGESLTNGEEIQGGREDEFRVLSGTKAAKVLVEARKRKKGNQRRGRVLIDNPRNTFSH